MHLKIEQNGTFIDDAFLKKMSPDEERTKRGGLTCCEEL